MALSAACPAYGKLLILSKSGNDVEYPLEKQSVLIGRRVARHFPHPRSAAQPRLTPSSLRRAGTPRPTSAS